MLSPAEPRPEGARRRPRHTPKGRQVDPAALEEVRALLGKRERRRDLLIEHLHLIQDRYGHLSAAHLAALAQEMKLALAEVYEVATFYAHFDVVKEGEAPPPADAVAAAAAHGGHPDPYPTPKDFDAYRREGGYALLAACLNGTRTRDDIIKAVSDANLRGLGGAGFPTGRKWTLVRAEPAPRLVAVNADEGEPGTFKDRYYLERDPHRFIEGMLIAAWVVEAPDTYVYIRDEYPEVRLLLEAEIAKIENAGLSPHTRLELRRGAGAYICGEESAMIESIEGKRGLPRHRPPYVAQVGLFGR